MTLATLLLVNSISTLIGTFVANFALLWLIGKQADAAYKKQQDLIKNQYDEAINEYNKEYKARLKRAEDYIKMES